MSEAKPLTKGTLISIGSLTLLVVGAVTVAGFISWDDGRTEKVVKATMKEHAIQPIDAAHPDIEKHYVSKRELNGAIGELKGKVDQLKRDNRYQRQVQRAILQRLPRRPLRNHAPFPPEPDPPR
jgi:hypothetical protein